ncbi:MAG: hypothetical protein OTJ44_02475 [Planctomycetota bacterium]|nr:hypothetical protein [Planctomycetota bacterium]
MNQTRLHRLLTVGLLALVSLLPVACIPGGSNLGGSSSGAGGDSEGGAFYLETVEWGRLVDVVDRDGQLVQTDVVIRAELSLAGDYSLSNNPVTEAEVLTILNYAQVDAGFDSLFTSATSGLDGILTKGPSDNQPYTMIPRNAAMKLTFSAPLAQSSEEVTQEMVQFYMGTDYSSPFLGRFSVQESVDGSMGILIFDPTISARQSTDLILPHNTVGFPASLDSVDDNFLLRLPTRADPVDFQSEVLRGASGERLSTQLESGEPVTSSQAGHDILVRSLRTGNEADPYHGFLKDVTRPSLLGVFGVTITALVSDGTDYLVTYALNDAACQNIQPKIGDTFEAEGDSVLLVISAEDWTDPGAYNSRVTLIDGPLPSLVPQSARLSTRYSTADVALQTCYVQVSPNPLTAPAQGTSQYASFSVQFDEPVDPASVTSMRTLVLTAFEEVNSWPSEVAPFQAPDLISGTAGFTLETAGDYIDRQRGFHFIPDQSAIWGAGTEFGGRIHFGPIEVSNGSRSFLLLPQAGLSNPDGGGIQAFALALRDGADGIVDLAGNPLDFAHFVAGKDGAAAPAMAIYPDPATLDSTSVVYFALLGGAADENGDGMAEYGGQFTVGPSTITGRPIQHFSRTSDRGNEYIGAALAVPPANNPYEPLTPFGAVVMTLWRPGDFGFGSPALGSAFEDPNEFNMDIEGLSWAPVNGVILDESYARVSLALSHANSLPDEAMTPQGQAVYPLSGLTSARAFDENILGWDVGVTEELIFDGSYALRNINNYVADSGTTMLPWPEFNQTYTWRDTGYESDLFGTPSGTDSPGSPPTNQQSSDSSGFLYPIWEPGSVPSVGLSLLARFRCYPASQVSVSQNQFQVSQMVTNSALPGWRAFSAGGVDSGAVEHLVIPDVEGNNGTWPSGGWTGGAITPPVDNLVYWSQADFVVKVSRVYTHWFALGGTLIPGGFHGMTLEPAFPYQLPETEVLVEFRGSFAVTHGGVDPTTNPSALTDAASQFDYYGEDDGMGAVSDTGPWTTDFADLELNGATAYNFFQIRLTFVADETTDSMAEMDGLGIAYD